METTKETTMNTTTTTVTIKTTQNEQRGVQYLAEFKLDKRTKEAKNLAAWKASAVSDLYTIMTGYILPEGSEPKEYSTKYAFFLLKDAAAAVALVEKAKSLGIIEKTEVRFLDRFAAGLYHQPEDASAENAWVTSVLFGEHESQEYWDIRHNTENVYNDPFFLVRLAHRVAVQEALMENAARVEAAEAEAEANIPVTKDMENSLRAANENIAAIERSIANKVADAELARDYKFLAVKAATKRMLELFVQVCGEITQTEGVYRRRNTTEAFGLVVARSCNDSQICPNELFAEAVNEFRSNCRVW